MNPKSPLCTGASYTKQLWCKSDGANWRECTREPQGSLMYSGFGYRDYGAFCSEITELLIRDYGAFVLRLQSFWSEIMELLFRDHGAFFERFTATTRGLSYMNMMNPEILIAHTLQSPSWQNERITQLSCLCWDDISMQVTASIAVWWPLLLSIRRHYLYGQSQGVSRCTNQANCQCFFFSYFFLLANLGSLQRDWTIGLHMS